MPTRSTTRPWHSRRWGRSRRLDEAEARLRRALKLRPGYVEALAPLLGLLLDQGRAADADDLSQRALAAAPAEPRLLDLRGTIHRALGRLEDAIETYRRVL